MSAKISFGIDLGTTNSCISMIRSDSSIPSIIPLRNGNTIQSCVMLTKDNQLVVGKEAYQSRYDESSIYSVKRMMGTNSIIHLKNGSYSRDLTPVEVSSEILKEIVKEAEEYVGDGLIEDVTITVPAHFNDAQRRDTKLAGEMAGLNVVSIINEPTSAGLLYGLDKAKSNQTILVYDLGGGTFDVSILKVVKEFRKFSLLDINMNNEYNKTAINILGNDGDVHLGGDDIDTAIMNYIIESISKLTGHSFVDVKNGIECNEEGLEHLKLRVEIMKKLGKSSIEVNYMSDSYNIDIIGEEVEEKCYRPLFNRTYELVTRAMSSVGVVSIDNIVLVGGSTKSDIIRKMIKEKFPNINIMNTFEPDLSVGLGASVSSASITGVSDIASITDVVPISIGILLNERGSSEKIFSKVLLRDSPLPCVKYCEYTIEGDNDSVLIIDIMQGESTRNISELINIGEVKLSVGMFESRDFTIEYKCDLNGVLKVTAISGDKRIPIDITYSVNDMHKKFDSVDVDLTVLNKEQKYFYNNRIKRMRKAGVSEEYIKMFTPQLVLDGKDIADSVVNNLISKLSSN